MSLTKRRDVFHARLWRRHADTFVGKAVSVIEAGTGFGFMAIIIGYLPVLYQAFSRREQSIALLDARAGSPPTAGELFRRANGFRDCPEIERYLAEWEVWAADLLESHLSFPVLSFYRSQHDNQNWLAALAVALDASAVLLVAGSDEARRRAQLTFAMARHACVDLCLVYWLPPREPPHERLTEAEAQVLLAQAWVTGQIKRLGELRVLYEPFLEALSENYCFCIPRFFPDGAPIPTTGRRRPGRSGRQASRNCRPAACGRMSILASWRRHGRATLQRVF